MFHWHKLGALIAKALHSKTKCQENGCSIFVWTPNESFAPHHLVMLISGHFMIICSEAEMRTRRCIASGNHGGAGHEHDKRRKHASPLLKSREPCGRSVEASASQRSTSRQQESHQRRKGAPPLASTPGPHQLPASAFSTEPRSPG